MRSMPNPSRSHHAEGVLKPKRLGLANGTPLGPGEPPSGIARPDCEISRAVVRSYQEAITWIVWTD